MRIGTVAKRTLEQALKEVLEDDGKISKYEARVIRELIMADGRITDQEKRFLDKALTQNEFDDEAYKLLSNALMRAELK
jgi:hypothetical protein